MKRLLWSLVCAACLPGFGVSLFGASLALADGAPAVPGLRFIGMVIVPHNAQCGGTPVGGLSSIDYDPKTKDWLLISDDKSDLAPARFYHFTLSYDDKSFRGFECVSAVTFRQADGTAYPNAKAGGEVPDPEALRVDPRDGTIWWTSEGDRKLGLSPFVKVVDPAGRALQTLPTLDLFTIHKDQERGPRHNLSFEGLSFTPDGNSLWLGMETALYQDGPVATVEAGTMARMTNLDRSGQVLAQYAYPVDPIPAKPTGKFADNGVSEILAVDDHHLLALERSGVEAADGSWKNYIRIYEFDTDGATDIRALPTLAGADYRPVTKRLVLDLAKTPAIDRLDNLEGITFGPVLPNGHRSLVLVSDNNFNPHQITQILAFEVEP